MLNYFQTSHINSNLTMSTTLPSADLMPALIIACYEKQANRVSSLLEKKELRNAALSNHNAFNVAITVGYKSIVEIFLEKIPNFAETIREDSLYLASWYGHKEIVKLLLSLKPTSNSDLKTNLLAAAENGHLSVVQEYLKLPQLQSLLVRELELLIDMEQLKEKVPSVQRCFEEIANSYLRLTAGYKGAFSMEPANASLKKQPCF